MKDTNDYLMEATIAFEENKKKITPLERVRDYEESQSAALKGYLKNHDISDLPKEKQKEIDDDQPDI